MKPNAPNDPPLPAPPLRVRLCDHIFSRVARPGASEAPRIRCEVVQTARRKARHTSLRQAGAHRHGPLARRHRVSLSGRPLAGRRRGAFTRGASCHYGERVAQGRGTGPRPSSPSLMSLLFPAVHPRALSLLRRAETGSNASAHSPAGRSRACDAGPGPAVVAAARLHIRDHSFYSCTYATTPSTAAQTRALRSVFSGG